jgi:hypothetical protein
MSAPKGNQFWKARSSHGRGKIFETPDELWDACCEYFEWVEENPLWEAKLVSYQGVSKEEILPKMRAMTLDGLYFFLGISRSTWDLYQERDDFIAVTTEAEHVIREQKFTGAAAELLNPNIIARDLGLKDKSEQEHSGGISVERIERVLVDPANTDS